MTIKEVIFSQNCCSKMTILSATRSSIIFIYFDLSGGSSGCLVEVIQGRYFAAGLLRERRKIDFSGFELCRMTRS